MLWRCACCEELGRRGYTAPVKIFCSLLVSALLILPVAAQSLDGVTVEQKAQFARVIAEHSESALVPGIAVAVVLRGEPLFVGVHGVASLEHRDPVTRSSVFELASLTKHMTALALLDAAERGELSLDDALSQYVDRPPAGWRPISLDQLLSHTAGLAHRFEEKPHGSFLLDYTTGQLLESAKATAMLSEPGTDWSYSDQGYFLAGYALERATGERFAQLLDDRYFDRLGLEKTGRLEQDAIVPGRVDGYAVRDGELVNGRRVWQFGLMSHFGITSTIDDMVLWEGALWRSQQDGLQSVLPRKAVAATWEVARDFGTVGRCRSLGYARGWYVRRVGGTTWLDHGGFSGNHYVRNPETGLAVIVLTNREHGDGPPPSDLAWALAGIALSSADDPGNC